MSISEELFERASQVIPGGVNSPVRAFRRLNRAPFFVLKAQGAYLEDVDGKLYIDYVVAVLSYETFCISRKSHIFLNRCFC